jgi:GNAT superfamily N-acetyltransferase
VADLLVSAWRGPRPSVDGAWARVAPWRDGVHAVVAVTGRAMVSGPDDVTDAELAALGVDGWGHAHDPRVMTRLAGERGWVDVLDAVLLAEGAGAPEPWLVDRPDLRAHPRVQHALPIRGDVRVFGLEGDDETVLTLATGIGGLPELSFQVAPARRGTGLGTALARAARGLVPAGEPVAACVSPANVPSLRALLRAGFDPVGSVQVYRPER